MKVIILAGGLGTRLAEETEVRPKPMVEVGDRPILWHILKHYGHFGFKEFFVALGYKGEVIKRYFLDYYPLSGSMTVDIAAGTYKAHARHVESWTVNLVDTGATTNTGGRVRKLREWIGNETFLLTYGDGVSDIDLTKLVAFHRSHGKLATISAVRPPARFGGIVFEGDLVQSFTEKPQVGEGWINGGFMVLEPAVFDLIENDDTSFEANVLEHLSAQRQLAAYRHDGFWQCMDTLRDRRILDSLWASGKAPWKVWE